MSPFHSGSGFGFFTRFLSWLRDPACCNSLRGIAVVQPSDQDGILILKVG
jgi:hypothetical protein